MEALTAINRAGNFGESAVRLYLADDSRFEVFVQDVTVTAFRGGTHDPDGDVPFFVARPAESHWSSKHECVVHSVKLAAPPIFIRLSAVIAVEAM